MELAMENTKNRFLKSALTYAIWFQILVFPLKPRSKIPLTAHGHIDATKDPTTIKGYWDNAPNANVAGRAGEKSGIVILDMDERHGGSDSLYELEKRYGPLPHTPTTKTGGGGLHIFFRHPGIRVPNRTGLFPGIDIRGDGGYVVLPPSIHESGREYAWEISSRIGEIPFAPMPDWLLALITNPSRSSDQGHSPVVQTNEHWLSLANGVSEGSRNSAAASLCGHLLRRYVDVQVTLSLLLAWNRLNKPPLPEEEIHKVLNSILACEQRRRQQEGRK